MKEINGFNYSIKPVKDYKFRAKFEYRLFGEHHNMNFDIYTDNPSRNDVEKLFIKTINDKFERADSANSKIIFWTTKEQDEIAAEFIEDFLN